MIVDYTEKLARSLHVKGMINIQFIVYNDQVYVIEVNPRSSRTVPVSYTHLGNVPAFLYNQQSYP